MTIEPITDRDLPVMLSAIWRGPYPDYVDDVLATTAQRGQRSRWMFPGRWLPADMDAQSPILRRPAPALRAIVPLVSLALILAAGLLLAVGSRPKVPPPFGPAGNGVILFQTSDLDIVAGDPATGAITTLIDGPTSPDFPPRFSNDGRRFLFVRDESLMIANADGSGLRELIASPGLCMGGSSGFSWSPSGDRLVLTHVCRQGGVILDLGEGVMTPFPWNVPLIGRDPVGWLASTDQLVVMSERTHLSVVDADGTGSRDVATWPQSLDGWTLSPDGSKFAYVNNAYYTTGDPHPHVLDVESGMDTRLDIEGNVIQFSPDGTKLLVEIIDFRQVRTRVVESNVRVSAEDVIIGTTVTSEIPPGQLAMVPLEGGPAVPIDVPSSGRAGLMLSPDGSVVLAEYSDEATGLMSTWLFDIVSGDGRQVFWPASALAMANSSWQRLAP